MDVDGISGLQMGRDGLGAQAGKRNLPLRVLRVDEVDVERNLAVNTNRLNFLYEGGSASLQHGDESSRTSCG